ncbi:hypothetical protein B0H13DRAFT_261446 [Mycena leptocephala]|nr:hypothetical protein B0H13DRAFT_261446 [Mycena leptocephala]
MLITFSLHPFLRRRVESSHATAYYATTGKNAQGELVNAGQQISREEVLQLYTRANQWFLGAPDENFLGALEVARYGDIVVLNEDYFTVPDEELKKLRSVLTVVGELWFMRLGEVGRHRAERVWDISPTPHLDVA